MEVGPYAGRPFLSPVAVPPARPGPWPVVAAAVAGCWTVAVVAPAELVGWLADQVRLATGLDRVVWLWPVVAVVTVLLAGVPALLLALLPRSGAVRTTGRAWLGGLLALGALTGLRALPPVHHEAYLAALAATAVLLAVVLPRLVRGPAPTPPAAGRPDHPAAPSGAGHPDDPAGPDRPHDQPADVPRHPYPGRGDADGPPLGRPLPHR
ncbi:hypothetical protein ABT344_02195, partial [Micromonospora carbonacea]